jgi:hypothetical protein
VIHAKLCIDKERRMNSILIIKIGYEEEDEKGERGIVRYVQVIFSKCYRKQIWLQSTLVKKRRKGRVLRDPPRGYGT